jgi:hypothetical protein
MFVTAWQREVASVEDVNLCNLALTVVHMTAEKITLK